MKSSAHFPSPATIEFKDYRLRYQADGEDVLRGLNFKVEEGEKVGIVGRTGAGKSTICLALCRIIEAHKGRIEIGGQDISELELGELRKKITIIPQDPTLFEGSLRFNLDPTGTVADAKIESLVDEACLRKLVERDPLGLDQPIEIGGENLASGEKQLICICRAALQANKIVLMDEATANIDIKTEELIQKLIHKQFATSTVLTIAHRLNTIVQSDRVLVLGEGRTLEFDSPKTLLADKHSHFHSLAAEIQNQEKV